MTRNSLLTFLLIGSIAGSVACSKSMAADTNSVATQSNETPGYQKVRVLNVRQHEDRMPVATDDGRAMPPRVITVITFETDACVGAQNDEFRLSVQRKGKVSLAKIENDGGTCSENARAQFEVVTNQLRVGESLVVVNPVLVNLLAATE